MMPRKDVSSLFNKFAGREVPMVERSSSFQKGGKTYTVPVILLECGNDPLLEEMKKVAKDNGLTLRLWWKGRMGTMDHRLDRVNVHIEKCPDGKWRIGKNFNLG